ncbi:MAG: hypothetical protein WC242_00405 [Candidatus Paceibacterota bacterium]|jgi:hypothetical protein
MSIGEPGEPQPNVEFDPEKHVKIPEEEGGGFVKKEAYETQELAKLSATYAKALERQQEITGKETNFQDILHNEANKENKESDLSEEEKLIERVKDGRANYRDLPEYQRRNLKVIQVALERNARFINFVPDDIREKIEKGTQGL